LSRGDGHRSLVTPKSVLIKRV